jgi:CRP/FNR family transcriptional regulator, cyclic AMP receptor protein
MGKGDSVRSGHLRLSFCAGMGVLEQSRAVAPSVPGSFATSQVAVPPSNFLASLSSDEQSALLDASRPKVFAAGTTVMHEGQVGESIAVLTRGVVKVTYVTEAGTEVLLGFCGPGQLVGELSVMDREPRTSTVTAMESTEALLLSSSEFLAIVEKEPRIAMAMLRSLIVRFRDIDRKLVEFGASDALGRVASRLLELTDDHGQPCQRGVTITLSISQDELAGWAGCSKKSVVTSLQTLRRLGCIETARRRITVLDLDGLRARAARSR